MVHPIRRCLACFRLVDEYRLFHGDRVLCLTCAESWMRGKRVSPVRGTTKGPISTIVETKNEEPKPVENQQKPINLADMVATATQADWKEALEQVDRRIDGLERELQRLRKYRGSIVMLMGDGEVVKPKTGLSPEVRDRVKALHKEGLTDEEIADRLSMPKRSVTLCILSCKKHGSL